MGSGESYIMRNLRICTPHQILLIIKNRIMRWAKEAAHMREIRGVYRVLWRNEGKGPFGRPARRWEDNIRLDPEDLRWEGVDYIGLAQDNER
jgi:hypothetical protein